MKKLLALLLCVSVIFGMAACTEKGGDVTESTEATTTADDSFEYDINSYEFYEIDDFSQYIELGEYEGITVTATPTDEEVDAKIQQILMTYAEKEEVTDGTVEEGDTVNIDYTGYIDGKAFEGGSATGSDLVIGSNTFIDGFEDGLIGAKKGDSLELDLTFPENYHNADFAGVDVTFEVKVNKITRADLPELNDEFAGSYNSSYATVADMKEGIKAELKEENMKEDKLTSIAWNKVVSNCEVKDIPEEMIKYYYDSLYASYVYYVYYNYEYASFDEYLAACEDLTKEQLQETFMTQAQGYAGSELVYRAICNDKGYEISDEAYNEYKTTFLENNNTEPTDIEIRQGLMWEYASKCVLDTMVVE